MALAACAVWCGYAWAAVTPPGLRWAAVAAVGAAVVALGALTTALLDRDHDAEAGAVVGPALVVAVLGSFLLPAGRDAWALAASWSGGGLSWTGVAAVAVAALAGAAADPWRPVRRGAGRRRGPAPRHRLGRRPGHRLAG